MRTRSLLLALLLPGCSLLIDPSKLDPHVPADLATFCTQAEALLSERGAACQATTLEAQAQNRTWLPCSAWGNEIAATHASYGGPAAADCLEAIRRADCGLLFGRNGGLPDVCRGAVVGNLALTDPCQTDLACGSGYCRVGTTCPGSCTAHLLINDTGCSADPRVGGQCVPGTVCHAGTCLPMRFVNEPCAGMPEVCEPVATCDGTICVPRRAVGEACAAALDCQPGLVCGAILLSPLTRRCLVPVALGGACTQGLLQCLGGAHCQSAGGVGGAGICVADPPVGSATGACDLAAAEPRGCLGGYCGASGVCTDFIPEASACTSTAQCGPGGLCNAGVNVCFKSCAP